MSPGTETVSSTTQSTNTATCGRVKWFNNRAGYGFITVSNGDHKGEDVFVHHSAIQVEKEQYRYLVQGEYVDFKLCEVNDQNHKWQAGEVGGVSGGQLMCETRLESRAIRSSSETKDTPTDTMRSRRNPRDSETTHYRVRTRGPGPREGDQWMLVRRNPNNRSRATTTDSSQHETMSSRPKERANYRVLENDGEN